MLQDRTRNRAAPGASFAFRALHVLGLVQTRCAHCLRAFSPVEALCRDPLTPPPDGPAGAAAPLCPECRALFAPYDGPRCPRCGLPPDLPPEHLSGRLPASLSNRRLEQRPVRPHSPPNADILCGHCLNRNPPWDKLAYYGLYRGALRDALLRLKFGGELSLALLLGACLLEAARCLPLPDAVTAMPQHPAHLRRRGFNQAHELARAMRRLAGLPLRSGVLLRPVPGTPQAGLSAAERRRNVLRSFRASPETEGLRFWLVDDVMTTGSTLEAATRALREAGAREVHVLFAARTPRQI